MTKSHIVDYANVLSDLKAKRKEIDQTIASLERFLNSGWFSSPVETEKAHIVTSKSTSPINKGIYESTIDLLSQAHASMKTAAIHEALIKMGVVGETTKVGNVGVTLYKAIKNKKDCQIKLVGKGEWGLKELS